MDVKATETTEKQTDLKSVLDAEYKNRAEPSEIVQVLKKLR